MSSDNKEAVFLTNIIKELVNNPEKINVTQETDRQGIKLTLVS